MINGPVTASVSPATRKVSPVITLRRTREELELWFEHIERVDTNQCQWCMPYQNNSPTMSAKEFGTRVRGLRPMLREKQRRIHEKMMWVWLGLGMRDDAHTAAVCPQIPQNRG